MIGSRTVTALVGLLASLLISAAAWYYFETFLLFLFVPFVPFLLRGRTGSTSSSASPSSSTSAASTRVCPVCGFRTTKPAFEYCPRDGTRLE